MERRLLLAKELLNPDDSVLIVTIDEKEYLRLGLLLEQMFPEADIQMVTSVINPAGWRATASSRESTSTSSSCASATQAVDPAREQTNADDERRSDCRLRHRRGATFVERDEPSAIRPSESVLSDLRRSRDAIASMRLATPLAERQIAMTVAPPHGLRCRLAVRPDGTEGELGALRLRRLRKLLAEGLRARRQVHGREAVCRSDIYLTVGRSDSIESGDIDHRRARRPDGRVIADYEDEKASACRRRMWNKHVA